MRQQKQQKRKEKEKRKMNSSDILLEARQINQSLQRSRHTLYSTVDQTETTREIIQSDGNIIQNTLQQQKYELKTSLESTKKRLRKIKQSESLEKWGIYGAMGIFMFIVVYICLVRFGVFFMLFSMISCFFTSKDVTQGEL
jgi:preprotein translocase subunit SecF